MIKFIITAYYVVVTIHITINIIIHNDSLCTIG